MKITLLDGTEWEKKDIIEKSYDDDFYYSYLGKAAFKYGCFIIFP